MKVTLTRILMAVFICAGLTAFAVTSGISADSVTKITKDELKDMLGNPDLVVLDVRTGRDWSSSEFKIQGAHRAAPGDYDDWHQKFSKDKTLVLYCA